MAQFSRNDILICQGRKEGIKAFTLDKMEDRVQMEADKGVRKHQQKQGGRYQNADKLLAAVRAYKPSG